MLATGHWSWPLDTQVLDACLHINRVTLPFPPSTPCGQSLLLCWSQEEPRTHECIKHIVKQLEQSIPPPDKALGDRSVVHHGSLWGVSWPAPELCAACANLLFKSLGFLLLFKS